MTRMVYVPVVGKDGVSTTAAPPVGNVVLFNRVVPSGLYTVTTWPCAEVLKSNRAVCPTLPSTRTMAIVFVPENVADVLPPKLTRVARATFASVYGAGTKKKSSVLVAWP